MLHGSNGRKSTPIYRPLFSDTADAAAELYTEVFLNDEPMTHRHGIEPVEFLPYAREYLHFCANQQLSFIALDEESREVVGFILGSDLTTDWKSVGPGIMTLLSFFEESMAILGEVEHRCPDLLDIRPGTILHIFQLGVRNEYRGQGIAACLIHCILDRAIRRGFQKVIADCTGPVSRHAFERCGFHNAGYVAYDEFRIHGQAFFHGLPEGITLMIREL